MKLSARNQISGVVSSVKLGTTTAHVLIEVAPGVTLTASITNDAVEELGLKEGKKVKAIVKASSVMVGIEDDGGR